MAKDRNTMAKRQREVDKRRKAEEKRDRRIRRRSEPKESAELPGQVAYGDTSLDDPIDD